MKRNHVPIQIVIESLDRLFSMELWKSDPAMSRFVPRVYKKINRDITRLFEPSFCERFNGIMIRSSERVGRVYCAAFPSPDILKKVFESAERDSLLFLHHPIDLEVSRDGFSPIPPETVERMREEGVSLYVCHAPMDCSERGTTSAMAQAFGVRVEIPWARYGHGYAGRYGSVNPMSLEELVEKGMRIFGVERVERGGACPDPIERIALIAGGGDDVEFFGEAERLGAQAYITGEWYTRTSPRDENDRAWCEKNRDACIEYAEESGMAFLGFSHAATEFLAMKTQMADFFADLGLEVFCVAQEDWWR